MSDKITIRGGKTLHGEVTISSSKNAAVAILPAVVLPTDCEIWGSAEETPTTSIGAGVYVDKAAAVAALKKHYGGKRTSK